MFDWIKNIYKNIKRINSTLEDYKKESVVESLPVVANLNRAKKFIEANKYDDAESLLLKTIETTEDALTYKYLGLIKERKHLFQDAVEYYKKSAQLNSTDKQIWLRLGMSELYSGSFEDSIKSFEKADKLSPMNTDIYTGWGMALMRLKKYLPARDKFAAASKISKYNFTAILLSAVMEIRLGEYNSAEEKLRFLCKVAPNESSNYEYANLKLIKYDYEEAIRYANKSLEINKQMLPAYFVLGEAYSILQDQENTTKSFLSAIELDLDSTILRFEWGKACIRLLDFKSAKEQFELSLQKDCTNKDAKLGLALVNAYENNFELLNELQEKNTENVYIQEATGLKYLNENNPDMAIEMFKKALTTDEKQAYNYYNLAQAYKIKNDPNKVKEYFDKFLEKYPQNLKGLLDYSQWLINISDFAQAQRKLKRAERISPDNTEILNLLFLTNYTLVKNNLSEYNIKEALSVAQKAENLGRLDYKPEKQELEDILKNIQGNN